MRGTVKFFDPNKGFGFIVRDDNAPDVFLHIYQLKNGGLETVEAGTIVDFELAEGRGGKWEAVNIRVVRKPVAGGERPAARAAPADAGFRDMAERLNTHWRR